MHGSDGGRDGGGGSGNGGGGGVGLWNKGKQKVPILLFISLFF